MRAIRFCPYAYAETPEPEPGPGQVRVRTEAVGVGVALVRMLCSGAVPGDGPGAEIAGRVSAVGPGVTGFRAGDRVAGLAFTGAYAESILTVPALLTPIPDDVPVEDALALVRGGLIALGALHAAGPLPGRSVLLTAAASGTGHLAVQLARALGAERVVAAVGGVEKAAFLTDIGADAVVTYDEPSWGDPVDVVLDGHGGDLIGRGLDALAPYGTLVAYGGGGGTLAVSNLLSEHKTVRGFSIGLISRERPEVVEAYRAELWRLRRTGALRTAHTAVPFDDIEAAVGLVASRANRGRVLLRV